MSDTTATAFESGSSTVNLPDHPCRRHVAFQLFNRLWRPAAGWVTVVGLAYAFVIGPAIEQPLGEGYLIQVLVFAGGLLGLRTYEKTKGVA